MPQTVQSAPPEVTRTETSVSPLPATEKDFHTQSPRTANHFRIWLSAAIVVLLVAAFFVYRYVTSYESLTTRRWMATSIPSAPASRAT